MGCCGEGLGGHALEFGEIEVQAGWLQEELFAVDGPGEVGGGLAFEAAGVDGDGAGEGLTYYFDITQNYAAFDPDHVFVGATPCPGAEHMPVACAEGYGLVGLYHYKSGIEVLTFWV